MGWMAAPRRERHALGAARMWPFAGLLGLVAAVLLAGCGETNAWPAAAIPPGVEAPASAVEAVRLAIRAHPDDPIALGRAWGALLRDDVAWAGLCVVLDDAQRESRDLSLVLEALARLRGKVSPAPPSIQARLLSMAEHRRDGARHAAWLACSVHVVPRATMQAHVMHVLGSPDHDVRNHALQLATSFAMTDLASLLELSLTRDSPAQDALASTLWLRASDASGDLVDRIPAQELLAHLARHPRTRPSARSEAELLIRMMKRVGDWHLE